MKPPSAGGCGHSACAGGAPLLKLKLKAGKRTPGWQSSRTKTAGERAPLGQAGSLRYIDRAANRLQLNEKLEEIANRCRRLGTSLAVMFLDIDHFKQINDTLGHAVGDYVLKEFAVRLTDRLRATDIAGRLAGDEFVVYMEAPHTVEDPTVVARKILDAMQRPWTVDGQALQVTTSIGIVFASDEIPSADALLAKADGALYKAKSAGRNQFNVASC